MTFDRTALRNTDLGLDPAVLDDPEFGFQLALRVPGIVQSLRRPDRGTRILLPATAPGARSTAAEARARAGRVRSGTRSLTRIAPGRRSTSPDARTTGSPSPLTGRRRSGAARPTNRGSARAPAPVFLSSALAAPSRRRTCMPWMTTADRGEAASVSEVVIRRRRLAVSSRTTRTSIRDEAMAGSCVDLISEAVPRCGPVPPRVGSRCGTRPRSARRAPPRRQAGRPPGTRSAG